MNADNLAHLISLGMISVLLMFSPFFSRLVRIPPSVVEILLGASAAYFGIIHSLDEIFYVLSKIGFFFLMFLAGMEVELKGFIKLGRSFIKRVFIYFFTTYTLATIIVFTADYPPFYIIAFPVMSVGMIVALLKYYGKNQIWLNMALKIGILGEFLSILALVVVNGFYSHGLTFEFYKTLFIFFIFIFFIFMLFTLARIIFWWFPVLKLYFIPREISMNEDIRFAMMLFFALIAIVLYLKIDVILGAFFAGMIIANFFQYNQELPKKLHDFGFGFLIPLFFIYVGSTLDINIILENKYLFIDSLQLMGIMLLLHLCAHWMAHRFYFKNLLILVLGAFSSSIPLTFLVVTATLGESIGAISRIEYFTFVIAAISEGVFFVFIIKLLHFLASWYSLKMER